MLSPKHSASAPLPCPASHFCGECRRHFRHGSSPKSFYSTVRDLHPWRLIYTSRARIDARSLSHPHPWVLIDIATPLTWNHSVSFLPKLRGLFRNINVVTCLQNKGATLLYNLYFRSICLHVPFPPPVLLQSPDGAWPAPANSWLPLALVHAGPLLSTECAELRCTHTVSAWMPGC